MSVTCSYSSAATVAEILENNPDSASANNRIVTHNLFNSAHVLDSGSTPPATKVAAFKQALTAGAATIDLTALVGTNGKTVDGSSLKVQVLKVKNAGANPLTINAGVANGYDLLGVDWKMILPAGAEVTLYTNDASPDIAGADCEIDLAGTLVQESEWTIVMG